MVFPWNLAGVFTRLLQDHCRKKIFDGPNLGVWVIKKCGGAPRFYFSLCFPWGNVIFF
jgi:hypothetical protein